MRAALLALLLVVAPLAGCIAGDPGTLGEDAGTPNATDGSTGSDEPINTTQANTTPPEANVSPPDQDTSTSTTDGPDQAPGPIELWERYIEAVGDGEQAETPRIEDPGHADEHVVVALLDTGVNPFHEAFRTGQVGMPGDLPVQAVDQASGQPPLYVPIQPVGSIEQTEWLTEALEPRTLYSFAGTNLMFYSFDDDLEAPDWNGHGTATAGIVARNAPGATILMVQIGDAIAEPAEWIAEQPWIDIVSVSIGTRADGATDYACYATVGQAGSLCAGYADQAERSRAAVASGKLWVNSAGNEPTPMLTDQWDGPPWVISVGGADSYRQGEAVQASKTPDVLSDFIVDDLPDDDSVDETFWATGTSLATPTVAATLADAILTLREKTGHTGGIENGQLVPRLGVANEQVRDAMNRTAIYWGPEDYRPTAPGHPDGVGVFGAGSPILPGAPWVQMGWGYVNASLSEDIVQVLSGQEDPAKPQGAVEHMQARQQARQAMWS